VAQASNDTAAACASTERQTLGLGSATWADAGIIKNMKIKASEKYLMPSPLVNL